MAAVGNFLDELMFRIDAGNLAVRSEQLRARLKLFPYMVLGQVLAEPIFVWLMWDADAHRHLLLCCGRHGKGYPAGNRLQRGIVLHTFIYHFDNSLNAFSLCNRTDTVKSCKMSLL